MNELNKLSKKLTMSLNNFFIQNRIKSAVLGGDLVFVNWNVSTKITITDKKIENSSIVITEKYIISSPEWDREFVDYCCSMGQNEEELIANATKNAAYGILTPVFMYNNGDITSIEKSFYEDVEHMWNVYAGSTILIGSKNDIPKLPDPNYYWDGIKEEVLKNLGNQKTSFVKIFMCNIGNGEIAAECTLDNELLPDASDILFEYVKEWNAKNYCTFKQYILISQDRKTYVHRL